MSFDHLMNYIMSIWMCMQNFITIFHSIKEIGLFSLFQNLALGIASPNDKNHFEISWTRCRQYQCICKILSKYSQRLKSYRHFSRTGRGKNLHKLSGDKIKCLIIGHTMKVNLQFQLTFFRVVQLKSHQSYCKCSFKVTFFDLIASNDVFRKSSYMWCCCSRKQTLKMKAIFTSLIF